MITVCILCEQPLPKRIPGEITNLGMCRRDGKWYPVHNECVLKERKESNAKTN